MGEFKELNGVSQTNVSDMVYSKGELVKALAKVILWFFGLLLVLMVFYQTLPVVLVLLGSTVGLFRATGDGLPIVDYMVFLLTGGSLSVILTWGLMAIIKRINGVILQLAIRIRHTLKTWYYTGRSTRKLSKKN